MFGLFAADDQKFFFFGFQLFERFKKLVHSHSPETHKIAINEKLIQFSKNKLILSFALILLSTIFTLFSSDSFYARKNKNFF